MEIVGVIVGGILAVIGGIAGHFITDHFAGKREAATLLRERIERFVKSLRENAHWLEAKRDELLWRVDSHDAPSPVDEASTIQMLYFPELADEMKAVLTAQTMLVAYLYGQRIEQLKDKDAWHESWNSDVLTALWGDHLKASQQAVEKCREILQALPHG